MKSEYREDIAELKTDHRVALSEFVMGLGDDRLILGHRLSEWCGHGPILEEDIALTNIALDLIGQAEMFLNLAGELEGENRDADILTYFREAREFRCSRLVEQPNGDFACTMVRQVIFDTFEVLRLEALSHSRVTQLAAIANKALKETRYHLRHAREWCVRLGGGTKESHERMQRALHLLWPLRSEMGKQSDAERQLVDAGLIADPTATSSAFDTQIRATLSEACLTVPEDANLPPYGRQGLHSEHLGHILAELQILRRSFPSVRW